MKKVFLFAFILMAFAQWIVPGQMLWLHNLVSKKGKAFKFQTAPVDPAHPFKGRYVALNFSENSFKVKNAGNFLVGKPVYAIMENDQKGFARIKKLSVKEPVENVYYIKCSVQYLDKWTDSSLVIVNIKYPFEEYYMEEFKAPKAERLYSDSSLIPEKTYAVVKVHRGDAVIEDLYINNQRIEELIK